METKEKRHECISEIWFSEMSGRTSEMIKAGMFIMIAIIYCMNVNAQESAQIINISGAKIAYPLIEKWISEYSKTNTGVSFRLIKNPGENDKINLRVSAYTRGKNDISGSETLVTVGRYALLPITNEKNQILSKQIKNGIGQKGLKEIFLKKEDDWGEESKDKTLSSLKVYIKTSQSPSAKVLADYLGKPSTDLNGVFVVGDDIYLTSSILKDTTGISYNTLGLIYDLTSRLPISGLKVLPIDLNNDGRLEEDEQVYGNLDKVIFLLENSKCRAIPTDYVGFIFDSFQESAEVINFVNWVITKGQQYNHSYGFLSDNSTNKNSFITEVKSK
jgi:phosphate transport system substrate-binding protein